MEIIDEKEYRRIQWKYLMESKDYEDYVEWEENAWGDLDFPIPSHLEKNRGQFYWLKRIFGNVHKISFDEWWEKWDGRRTQVFKLGEEGFKEYYDSRMKELKDSLRSFEDWYKKKDIRVGFTGRKAAFTEWCKKHPVIDIPSGDEIVEI